MKDSTWLEVSLIVDGELAEAAAEVLARFAPNGVAIESTAVTAEADDSEGRAVGPLRVSAYLRMNEQIEETRRRLEEALWFLGRIRPLPAPEFRLVKETDWSEAWKQHYHPIGIGRRLMIVPAWLENPFGDRIPVRIDPGMAFGTGTHPTTQLCLQAVEAFFPGPTPTGKAASIGEGAPSNPNGQPATLIDLGCGSGILAVAALKLGAQHALGVDIDPDSVQAAGENAVLNDVAERFEAGLGSLAEILKGDFSLRQAPLVLANILAPVIIRLLDEGLAQIVSPGGALVLSGIIAEQAPDVQRAAERVGLRLAERRQEGDWVALTMLKS